MPNLTLHGWLQSILQEINPEYSLEGLMLTLKLQYFGHLMRRADSRKRPWFWERLRAGGEEGNRGWDGWMASPTQWTWVQAKSRRWWRTGKPGVLQSMGSRSRHNWVTELTWMTDPPVLSTCLNLASPAVHLSATSLTRFPGLGHASCAAMRELTASQRSHSSLWAEIKSHHLSLACSTALTCG